jgi:uncharacterized NAD-dependent epimerase/dehydratase family protein
MNTKAIILAQDRYDSINGKTAHGLVQFSKRYEIAGVIDSTLTGRDAGEVLDGIHRNIAIFPSLSEALSVTPDIKTLIIGVANAGGILPDDYYPLVGEAIGKGMTIVNGLHLFLSDDPELCRLAMKYGAELIDVRKMFNDLRISFSGKIKEVTAKKVAVIGTDGIIGKRTTAINIYESFQQRKIKTSFVAMGQTGWMQGFKHAIVLDSIVLDFITGAIEDVVWNAWKEDDPEVIVTHGEGAMFHPADPGGFELLAAAKPEYVILQYAPERKTYALFPEYEMAQLDRELKLIEAFDGKKPIAITLYTKELGKEDALKKAREIEAQYNILTRVPYYEGVDDIVSKICHQKGCQTMVD